MKVNPVFLRNVPGLTEVLTKSCIGVAGCGGLGSNAAVALTRAGAGHLILADMDSVEQSNLNRQYFFQHDVGKRKVDALSAILRSINPEIQITSHFIELTPNNIPEIYRNAAILIEAFDIAERKKWLIDSWCSAYPSRPVICGNGLSGCGCTEDLKTFQMGQIYFCGDGRTDMSMGLCAPRVAIVANMQANLAIELLLHTHHFPMEGSDKSHDSSQ